MCFAYLDFIYILLCTVFTILFCFQKMLLNYLQPVLKNVPSITDSDIEHSSKMMVLDNLLSELKAINERIVLISYSTRVSSSSYIVS